jgi:large subunit ribosomal protein L14
MIRQESRLKVADNSGIVEVLCIRVLGGTNISYASLGTKIIVTAKKVLASGKIKQGQVCKAIVVRTKKEYRRKDGSYIRFSENSVVIVDDKWELKATRVFGPVPKEIKDVCPKVCSLASEIV